MRIIHFLVIATLVFSCQKKQKQAPKDIQWLKENPPELSAEEFVMDSPPILIKGARIITANGPIYEKGNLLMAKGIIQKVSADDISISKDTQIIDGSGLTVTPGLIDVHSHIGVFPSPFFDAHDDTNESVRPTTADVWAEHAFWTQDSDLWKALDGGITTIQVLPGSANLFGGRSLTMKLLPKISAREMRFPGAPQGLKMACGENPKRVYSGKELKTRMGSMAAYRKEFQKALEYAREWEGAGKDKSKLPKRDLTAETLVKVLKGEILVQFHCYRADDINAVLDLAKEFGFSIRAIHHGLEAYKLAPRLAQENVAVATWADWWGFKAEAYDGIPHNIALLENAGAMPVTHSDSPVDIRFLNVETGKAWTAAKKLGLDISEDKAFAWITKNPAWVIGLEDKIGTLEKGKMADVVLWDGHPFSVFTKSKMVFINGKPVFDREKKLKPRSDFEIGYNDMNFYDGRDFHKTATVANFTPLGVNKGGANLSDNFDINNVQAFIGGKWLQDAKVSVRNGVIQSINSESPAGDVTQIDGKGQYLTPGLIDSYSNVGLYNIANDSLSQDIRTNNAQPHPDFQAADALDADSVRIPLKRLGGVTTSIIGIQGGIAASTGLAYDMVEGGGFSKTPVALFGTVEKTEDREHKSKNRAEIWSQLRTLIGDASYYMKNKNAYFAGNAPPLSLPYRQLEAMIPVLTGEVPWILYADRADDIQKIIALKERSHSKGLKIQFVIAGASESWMVADQLKEHKIPVMMAPNDQHAFNFSKARARFDLAAYLQSKGVTLIITDTNDHGANRLNQEAGMAVRYGLSPEDALTAITETPSTVFKLNRGVIAPNKVANLVLWNGNPLEPTSSPEKIWIAGKDQSLVNRQTQLAEKYLKLQRASK